MRFPRYFFLSLLLVLGSSCLDQYKPFSYWNQLEDERVAAKNYGITKNINGDTKYLADDGTLQTEKSGEAVDPKETETADEIYSNFCATCHHATGKGVPGMNARDFTTAMWQKEISDEEIAMVIKEGTMAIKSGKFPEMLDKMKTNKSYNEFSGAMAPSGGRFPPLNEVQIKDMVKKIRTFSK